MIHGIQFLGLEFGLFLKEFYWFVSYPEEMAVSLSRLTWWWWGGKDKEPAPSGSSVNSLQDWGFGFREQGDSLKFHPVRGPNVTSPTRKVKRKWKSREERRRIDKEYDMVLVPSDGACLTGSESDDSDWSIGWLEPHAPGFQSDDEAEDSFGVLVPCYRHGCKALEEESSNRFSSAIKSLPIQYSTDAKEYMEQWLSSLNNF